jgi:hypothetical protein
MACAGGEPGGSFTWLNAATNTIVAATLTTSGEGDAGQVGPLLDQTEGPIDTVMADGACDGEPTYQTVAELDPAATVVIPPRSTAVPGSGADPTQRDRHIEFLTDRGRLGWQRETNYGRRSRAETAMSRYKRILGNHLHARKLIGQQAEAAIGVAVLNRMIDAGRPDSVHIA